MTDIPNHLRVQVVERAGGRCEYCRIPTRGQIAQFPIDHIVPQSKQGRTDFANLALACPRCNGYKWAHEMGRDPETGAKQALFNPRTQIWREHFRWLSDKCEITGVTPGGRATVATLRMNDPEIVAIRRLLKELGISVCDEP